MPRKPAHRKSVKKSVKRTGAKLPFGPGYKGLALAICRGNVNLANRMFGLV